MNPRLSYYGDLDERKERTMKWCTYSGNGCYKYPRQYASDCLDCPYFKECIPVEPERVKGKCTIPGHQRCTGTPGCEFCNTCYWWHPAPSPGLLQRMGMCEWVLDNNWYVVGKARNGGYPIISSRFMREDEARSLALGWHGVALRWQDGLR